MGGQLYAEKTGNNILVYPYDETGTPYAVVFNDTKYYYEYNLMGDVIGLFDSSGSRVVRYYYDPYGALTSMTDSSGVNISNINPLRYRGYYYDKETDFYYCQTRYYDPQIGRWINADDVSMLGADGSPIRYNLFAYCGNNPINRADPTGHFWDTAFDVVSLGISYLELQADPGNLDNWLALGVDMLCLAVPLVTGDGTAVRIAGAANDAADAGKAIGNVVDVSGNVKKLTGSYEIVFKSGNTYVGKGGLKRALTSAALKSTDNMDEVVSIVWKSAPNNRAAFIDEYISMCKHGGPNNSMVKNRNSYNKIWSPGRKYYFQTYGSYYQYGGMSW